MSVREHIPVSGVFVSERAYINEWGVVIALVGCQSFRAYSLVIIDLQYRNILHSYSYVICIPKLFISYLCPE